MDKKLLKENLDWYGLNFQMRKLQEELAELIVAVNHSMTLRGNGVDSFYEEFADVTIMMEQIKMSMSHSKLECKVKEKIKRMRKRLKLKKRGKL